MKVCRFNIVVAAIVLVALSAGCEKKKDLSPPPVNASAKDAVKLNISFDNPDDAARYNVSLKAEYGNLALECSNVRHLQGGSVDYPHGYVDIKSADDSAFVIYRDHFAAKEKCSWRFLGIGITFRDSSSGHWGGSGLSASQMTHGFEEKIVCPFLTSDGSATCLRKEIAHFPSGFTLKFHVN